jgi:hypothetical protein
MKPLILASSLLLSTALFPSCHKHSGDSGSPGSPAGSGQPVYLYVGGASASSGVYWKTQLNGGGSTPAPVPVPNSSLITSILVSGDSVIYMAGQSTGYWKNGVFVPVPSANAIQYLALSGPTLYMAGLDNTFGVAYWVNNNEKNLGGTIDRSRFPSEGTSVAGITGLTLDGANILVSGKLFFENEPGIANPGPDGNFGLLWRNGSLQLLNPGELTSALYPTTVGVAVAGGDTYVAGRLPDTTSYPGGYWKNGSWNSINNGLFTPASITAIGTDVYIPGNVYTRAPAFSQQAAYWKNGTLNKLYGNQATAVAVYGPDLYIVGVDQQNNLVVWKNGTSFRTLGSASQYTAVTMAVSRGL